MKKMLFLMDVDGTLIKILGGKHDYYETTVEKTFGVKVDSTINLDRWGKTDKQILAEFAQQCGISRSEIDEKMQQALDNLDSIAIEGMKTKKYAPVPCANDFLETVSKQGHVVAFLTGNTEARAFAKVKNAGISTDYFKFGAYGDETEKRYELVDVALNKALKQGFEFTKEQAIIVGDTKRDIEAARGAGIRVLAVAQGPESIEELKQHNPDFLFAGFEDKNQINEFLNLL